MEKKSVGLLELETAVLECFLEKTPLSPLGVNETILRKLYFHYFFVFQFVFHIAQMVFERLLSGF
jgi:hypothetical protein